MCGCRLGQMGEEGRWGGEVVPASRHGWANIWVTNGLACSLVVNLDDVNHLFKQPILFDDWPHGQLSLTNKFLRKSQTLMCEPFTLLNKHRFRSQSHEITLDNQV